VPAEDLAAWIDELRRRLDAGELAGHPPIHLRNEATLSKVELAVRRMLSDVESFRAMDPAERALPHFRACSPGRREAQYSLPILLSHSMAKIRPALKLATSLGVPCLFRSNSSRAILASGLSRSSTSTSSCPPPLVCLPICSRPIPYF